MSPRRMGLNQWELIQALRGIGRGVYKPGKGKGLRTKAGWSLGGVLCDQSGGRWLTNREGDYSYLDGGLNGSDIVFIEEVPDRVRRHFDLTPEQLAELLAGRRTFAAAADHLLALWPECQPSRARRSSSPALNDEEADDEGEPDSDQGDP